MRVLALIGTVAASVALSACGVTFADRDNIEHGCTLLRTSGRWDAEVDLYHDDPRSCPAGGQINDWRTAGGTLKDVFAQSPSSARLSVAELKIFNASMADNECNDLGTMLADNQQLFRWGDFNASGHESWYAPVFAEYHQGTWNPNYDCPVFYAYFLNGDQGTAWTRIKYYVNDM